MTQAQRQIAELLKLSRADRKQFKGLPAKQKRRVAKKELTRLGVLTKAGKLAVRFA